MRLSEIGNKEIIDIKDGSKHGQLWDAEMLFDENTGEIKALLVPDFGRRAFAVQKEQRLYFSCRGRAFSKSAKR